MSTIPADDTNIAYSPYNWHVTSARAKTINTGAYLTIAFTGDTAGLAALFDVASITATYPTIRWRVDGGPWTVALLAASVPLTKPPFSKWPAHIVELEFVAAGDGVDRWMTQSSALLFTGLSATGPISSTLARARPRAIFNLGDSLLEGSFTNGSPGTSPSRANNAQTGWGFPLRDLLGVEIGNSGFAGVGLTKAGNYGVPDFQTIWDDLWNGQPRDFSNAPALIVTVPGTNDSAANNATTTDATVALLNAMLAGTPSTTRIALVENWLAVKSGAIQAAIALCSDPTRVSWIATAGWWDAGDSEDGVHPFGYSNVGNLSVRLADALRPLLMAGGGSSGEMLWNGSAWVAI